MDGFERRRETKKTNIRNAAFELLNQFGAQKVSIAEIAKKANVSQVTIYNYFGSKDQLVFDVVKTYTESIFAQYLDILNRDISFKEKLERLIEQEMKAAETISTDFFISLLQTNPEVQQYYAEFQEKQGMPFFFRFVEEGKQSGHIDSSLSNDTIAFYFQMYYRELLNHPEMYRDEDKKRTFTKDILQLFFYGLIGKEKRS
ncbi:MAG TPA: TetR/AcrR family transcriptional regulator [Bacillales bacterium]|nr:TetR/AcrR family transcriptional regulator [Bacillales bacterium]